MKLKTILSIIVIGLLLTTSIASVNAFKIEEETMDFKTGMEHMNIHINLFKKV